MCGRFAQHSSFQRLLSTSGLPLPERELKPRYNIPPGTWVPVIRYTEDEGTVTLAFDDVWWGYKPHFADSGAPEPINATVEKVATSPYFKSAFAKRRCVIPADGWFEWETVAGKKQPHFLTREDKEPIWLAGIWTDRPDDKPGFAVITEPAKGSAKDIHSRMPLLLSSESLALWLDSETTERDDIRAAVRRMPTTAIVHWPVSTRVNRPGEDEESLLLQLS